MLDVCQIEQKPLEDDRDDCYYCPFRCEYGFYRMHKRDIEKMKKLEKALDKACDYLGRYGNGDTFVKMLNYQWKEWCMKDE